MSHLGKALLASLMAMALIGVASTPTAAARMSKEEKVALKQATVACKAEARGRKVALLARRKYVNTCVARALKGYPSMNTMQMTREHPNVKRLRAIQPPEWGCPSEC